MRIHKLTIAGFGPYRGEHTIDFDEFAGDIFLIDGKTGAGKSSILDAIVYALYNTVPRYDVSGAAKVRSDFCSENDPTFVELEFSIRGERYRVRRNPDYRGPGGKGGRVIDIKSNALLEHWEGGDWKALAEKPKEVGSELSPILVLTVDQFLQVIMLAQNKFSEFLNAKSDDRAKILSAVFRTKKFADIQQIFDERRKELDTQLAEATNARNTLAKRARDLVRDLNLPAESSTDEPTDAPADDLFDQPKVDAAWFAALIDLVDQAHKSAKAELDQQKAKLKIAGDQRDALAVAQTTFTNLRGARETVATAAERQTVMDAQRARVELAERAERVRPDLEASNTRRAALERETTKRESAFTHALANGAVDESIGTEVSKVSSAAVTARSDALKALVTALDEAQPEQAELEGMSEQVAMAQEKLLAATEEKTKLDERAAALPDLKKAASDDVTRLATLVDRVPALETAVTTATEQRDAVKKRDDLATQLATAEKTEHKASTAATEAATTVDTLLTQRNEGMAFVLAENLTLGEACAVCGSVEHPAPARSDAHIPDADEITAAKAHRDELESARKIADDNVAALRQEKSAADAVAADLTLDAAETQLAAARDALGDALPASNQHTLAQETLRGLDAEFDTINSRLVDLSAEIAALNSTIDTVSQAVATRQTTLDTLRGEYETLTERRDLEQERVDALTQLLEAMNAVATAEKESAAAEKALTASLATNGFENPDEIQDALLDPGELTRQRAEVTAFVADLEAAKKLLDEAGAGAETLVDVSEELAGASAAFEAQNEVVSDQNTRVVSVKNAVENLKSTAKEVEAHDKGNEALFARQAMMRDLADVTAGRGANTLKMRLETFVLAARLEDIMVKANQRLAKMTGGQYELQHDDSVQGNKIAGLGIKVLDNWTGQTRESQSLSGGETFLASMALAFGLAEVVSDNAGGIQLDTLFMDEGFAALDNEILDTAMNTLQELRASGRTIGLISHVGPMKEQIPNKIHVAKGNDGTSVITVHHG